MQRSKNRQSDKRIKGPEHDHDEPDKPNARANFLPIPNLIAGGSLRTADQRSTKPFDRVSNGGR